MAKRRRIALFLTKNSTSSYAYFSSTAVLLLVVIVFTNCVVANWWLLGLEEYPPPSFSLSPYTSYHDNCLKLNYLDERQQQLCSISERILNAISTGAKIGIEECQHQFRMSRWNCTTYYNTTSVFGGGIMSVRSRESAYVHAITSAGVAYAITRACSRGELNECSCDNRQQQKLRKSSSKKNWQWGGCSEDIHFGEKFSRDFVDSRENDGSPNGLMNQHNNEAGRRIIRSRMQRICKCHGTSGSCTVRICWRKLPMFREVGDTLSARYEGAVLVKMVERRKKHVKKLRAAGRDIKPPNRTQLVYLEESPDYCERNETLGIMGTKGRLCNQGSYGLDGCRLLCCGRGYQIREREVEEKCRCKFVWCCKVVCETCKYKKEEYVCN